MDAAEGFEEDGLYWMGSRDELEAWKQYKQTKALAFVQRGYSVEWFPDGDGWMAVFLPERHHAKAPEIRASVKFFGLVSQFGIDGGMVSKLNITRTRTDPIRALLDPRPLEHLVLFNYDRGPDVNRLKRFPEAERLYWAVIEELN